MSCRVHYVCIWMLIEPEGPVGSMLSCSSQTLKNATRPIDFGYVA